MAHITILWPLLVSLFGLAVYLWKARSIVWPALVAFGAGLLVTLWIAAGHSFNL